MTTELLPAAPPSRIFVVDDHPAIREGLSIRIGGQFDMRVCGEAADVIEALRLIGETKPDIVIIDILLKNGSGIELIKRVKERDRNARMLVFSMHNESLYAERSLRAGAMGYVNKEESTEKVIDAIRDVLQGKVYLSEPIADRLLHRSVGNDVDVPSRSSIVSQIVSWKFFVSSAWEYRRRQSPNVSISVRRRSKLIVAGSSRSSASLPLSN